MLNKFRKEIIEEGGLHICSYNFYTKRLCLRFVLEFSNKSLTIPTSKLIKQKQISMLWRFI